MYNLWYAYLVLLNIVYAALCGDRVSFCGAMSCLYVQRVFLSDVSSATHFLVDDFKFYMKRLLSCFSRIASQAFPKRLITTCEI